MPSPFYLHPFRTGQVLRLKKRHPCGSWLWQVERVGSDIALKCQGCGHLVSMSRTRLEKAIKQVMEEG